jgi:ABC-2 type transport system permease protein
LRSPETTRNAKAAKTAKQKDLSAGSAGSAVKPLGVLVAKEWRELLASRAWWVMLLLIGPLVGVSFISAVQTYAEASGLNGTAVGVGEAFSPLIGVWAPTFSACELAAAFLLPFVAIRLVAGDKQSGALKIEAQHPMPAFARIAAKALVLVAGWLVATAAPLLGVLLWITYGGSVYAPELGAVIAGHLLNAGLTIALAAAASVIADHPSTAAILTLGVTVGTWIVNFVAAVHGGIWERIAGYTPTAMVDAFQHGLVRLDVLLIAAVLVIAGLQLAAIWMRIGAPMRQRALASIGLAAATTAAIFVCAMARPSWDLSENRGNSFPVSDEAALRAIHTPLRIEVHLAPEDPRRADLDHRALSKLRRVMPNVRIDYVSATSIGMFEQTNPNYGEIWYEMSGTRVTSRVTTAEGVLESIYDVAGLEAPAAENEDEFRGHPLAHPPAGAPIVFYVAWPLAVAVLAFVQSRRP